MQIETVGKYQIHLMAQELSGSGQWDPFVTILKFDDDAQDFRCVLEKHHVADKAFERYSDAIDAARRAGTAWLDAVKTDGT